MKTDKCMSQKRDHTTYQNTYTFNSCASFLLKNSALNSSTFHVFTLFIVITISAECGPGSSVGIATNYGLDGRGSNPGGDENFRPSRPALGPTQPPVNRYRVFPGGEVRPGRAADHSPPSTAAVMQE